MKRNDKHAPSTFDPTEYTYHGHFYIGPHPWPQTDCERATFKALNTSTFNGNFKRKSTCDHCGARFHYGVAVTHTPTGDVLGVGWQCADRFELPSRAAFDHKYAVTQAGQMRKRAQAIEWAESVEGLMEALTAHGDTDSWIGEMRRKLFKYGSLSERQMASVFRGVQQIAQRAERKEKENERRAQADNAPDGRHVVEGRIVSVKWRDTDFGTMPKMTIELDGGARVWGTMPSALYGFGNTVEPERDVPAEDHKGKRIRFTATFKPSNDDKSFAFFSRPSKAEVFEPVNN